MNPITLSIACIASSLILASCGMPDIRIKRMVDESEIVGTWELDPKSSALSTHNTIDRYILDSSKQYIITFNDDGTCLFQSVLQMPTRYEELAGTWKISPISSNHKGCVIDLELERSRGGIHIFSLDLREDSGELVIWQFWGDPDSWNFIEYKRRQ